MQRFGKFAGWFGAGLFVAGLAATAAPSRAAVVHRCGEADGTVVYQDSACRAGQTPLATRDYVDYAVAEKPPAKTAAEVKSPASRTRGGAPSRRKEDDSERVVAHSCEFENRRWVQAEPCPKSLVPTRSKSGLAKGEKPKPLPVDQVRLKASQLCRALRENTGTPPGPASGRRGYRLNVLRAKNGC